MIPQNKLYDQVAVRVIGFTEMVEGFGTIFIGDRMPNLKLELMRQECIYWQERRKAKSGTV